ncbi:putative glutamine/gamma-aminobutyrate antiporter GadC [Bordetella avium]|uniref:putative glutamine/gamma-aminobutyrate antiporter GadC n=1 Tax=Bordetella avium TaxID=521 RepID=UPI000E0BEEA9|nr:putative glutamine/gamma-aminobutyrate antiporter GadC [Bordetella avium]RIQ11845.1 amino acid permease [Bordetella avium]RIQ37490.1 amino acid permease [Bordetella avium]RIQ38988.1 amino acid permease [Bordetella avium]RIQ40332.1 amino acid permease [Bordetella avium]RIQ46381.1 amino acid permease [Bordetella avium]
MSTSAASSGKNTAKKLTIGTLAIMNIVAVVSLRGLPAEAEYGLSSIFYYIFAAVAFLVPVSLVAAELATGWPQKGGVFRWVGEAFGPRMAFLSMFMLWIEVTVWFPTALTFAAVSLAFVGPDQRWDEALSANKGFVLVIVLAIYWLATFIAFKGVSTFARVAKWGGIIGTIIPAIILIVLGFAYLFMGGVPQIPLEWGTLVPNFSHFSNIVLAASIFLFYAGMEMNAIHVQEIDNPSRNYPIAIMLAALGTVLIFVLGTLAIAFVVPQADISLTQGLLMAYDEMFRWAGMPWLGPIVAIALAIGVLAGVVTWVAGPSTGLLSVAKAGYLPRWWQHQNKNGMATHILLVQACVVTLLAVLFVVLPSVQAAYQILSQLAVILYLIMYLLMFSSGIYLRYSQPNQPRPYRIPGGNAGMWVLGGVGFIAALLALIFSFIPPDQISVGSPATYVGILVVLAVICVICPFIIYALKKDDWRSPDSDFAPFTWEKTKQ